MKIRKNDQVVVIAGRDRSKKGRVLSVDPAKRRVIVEGVGMIKRHTKPNPQKGVKGGIVEREASIHVSNVMLVDPDTSAPTRVGYTLHDDGSKQRISRKSGSVVDK
ncbi:MAG: 50S ribosomal protein L24 [Acidobacteria bacterium]|jgi:large subunit ribosomal protein L24|nr:50S ribosomal protein L24 [Acidobacteriota bacterium]